MAFNVVEAVDCENIPVAIVGDGGGASRRRPNARNINMVSKHHQILKYFND